MPTQKPCIKKPKDLDPPDGAIVKPFAQGHVVLQWSDVACADNYDIRMQLVIGQTVVRENGHNKSRYKFTGLPGQVYEWKVRACNVTDCGPWTDPCSFGFSRNRQSA